MNLNLYKEFKKINLEDETKLAAFFGKHELAAAALVEKINKADSKEDITMMTSGIFDILSIMQNIRNMDSGAYIRFTSKFMVAGGKYKYPTLFNMAMMLDNNLKLAYVRDNWDKVAIKNATTYEVLNKTYEDLKKRVEDYARRGFYCELQCDFVKSWKNGVPSYRHERICDFYSMPVNDSMPIDSNTELIKWALLKIYEGHFVTFSILAYLNSERRSEVMSFGYRFGTLYEMVNNFGGHDITCVLPDLGEHVHQMYGDNYLRLCCPNDALKGQVVCMDAQRPILEG